MKTTPLLPFATMILAILATSLAQASPKEESGADRQITEGTVIEDSVIDGPKFYCGPRAKVEAGIESGTAGSGMAAPANELNPRFTTDLYRQLRATEGNVFFSPYSITQAMGMAYLGARGDTATEFVKALSLHGTQEDFGGRIEHLRNTLYGFANLKNDKLSIANALCATGIMPKDAYLQTVRTHFDAEVFTGGLGEINGWVAKKTEGHIDKILDRLDDNSACVLLNAVYFKGTWKHPFDAHNSHDGDFHAGPNKVALARMMYQRDRFGLARNDRWVAVELPYQTSCSMVLLMPAKADGMKELEESLDEALVAQVCKELKGKPQEIELTMPKFKIQTKYDLVPALKILGVADAFVMGRADFSAMYERKDIVISQVVHKATLEVDELGSVASAVTAVEPAAACVPAPVPEIIFDRPFLVLIRENNTNTTLFMGRISDPTR